MNDSDTFTPYFLDASALLKLVLPESGSKAMRQFFKLHDKPFYTTSLCFGEVLGVLKSRCFGNKRPGIKQDQYIDATNQLRSLVTGRAIKFEEPGLTEVSTFYEAAQLSTDHKIDLSDALQIVVVRRCQITGTTLITADARLAKAARSEKLTVWNCESEPFPGTART